jgi:hypothetical protein
MEPSLLDRILEFSQAFLWNWWALIAGAIFFMGSLPQNLLSGGAKEKLDKRVSPERRRTWLVRFAFVFLFVAAFQAYDDVSKRLRPKERELGEALRVRPTPRDRSKFIPHLQKFYAQGSALQRELLSKNVTDAQIDLAEIEVTKWLNEVVAWIQSNMTTAAAARFLNNTDKASFSFGLDGVHQPGKKETRDNILNSLAGCLTNLDSIMKSDQWDP